MKVLIFPSAFLAQGLFLAQALLAQIFTKFLSGFQWNKTELGYPDMSWDVSQLGFLKPPFTVKTHLTAESTVRTSSRMLLRFQFLRCGFHVMGFSTGITRRLSYEMNRMTTCYGILLRRLGVGLGGGQVTNQEVK